MRSQATDIPGPTKLQVFDIVIGIMYMVIALIELYVFIVAALVSPTTA
jgi:hypothetical protein